MTTTSPATGEQPLDDDAQRLAELGYKQELRRKWSGFSNFAISFSIISILAGCFTTFGQAWNNGGPVAISWGWPLISIFILIIGLCMSELVSAYPTAGGIYWWAATMGKPVHGWFTGWLNLVGLVAVTASVDYGCATFLNLTLSALFDGWAGTLNQAFLLFVIILALHGIINIYGHAIIDILQNISVWWHVAGAAAVVLILIVVP
ncbi:MAG TPA: amino acid permease, partial [Asanoa sp.]|nr:amino acid permease [Asanoa sp.]